MRLARLDRQLINVSLLVQKCFRCLLKESVFDICCSVGGRLFQAAGAPYENARWPKFNRDVVVRIDHCCQTEVANVNFLCVEQTINSTVTHAQSHYDTQLNKYLYSAS